MSSETIAVIVVLSLFAVACAYLIVRTNKCLYQNQKNIEDKK